jgi:hypothetical protein
LLPAIEAQIKDHIKKQPVDFGNELERGALIDRAENLRNTVEDRFGRVPVSGIGAKPQSAAAEPLEIRPLSPPLIPHPDGASLHAETARYGRFRPAPQRPLPVLAHHRVDLPPVLPGL